MERQTHERRLSELQPSVIPQSILESALPQELGERAAITILKKQNLISLLNSKHPHDRTEKDCRALADHIKHEPFFSSLAKNHKTLLEICSWIEYRCVKEGDYVYRIHQPAECFYVVVRGEVHLTYPEKENEEEEEDEKQKGQQSSLYATALPMPLMIKAMSYHEQRHTRKISRMNSIAQPMSSPKKKPRMTFQQRIVRVISEGDCFGDLGDSKRGTNALAKELTHLLVIRKQNYNVISHAQLKSDSKIKYDFLASVSLFVPLYRHALETILYSLEEVKLGYNSIVYNEEESLKYVFIVYRGEFKLYKKVNSRKQEAVQLQIQQKRISQRNICWKTIQLGEILGVVQAYNKVGFFQETCVCKSQQGIVLRIQRQKFLKSILSPDNNLQEISRLITKKGETKTLQMSEFYKNQEENSFYVRYLHTPSARSRRLTTQSSIQREKAQKKAQLRRLSTAHDNFFNQFNKTVKQQARSTRISINRSMRVGERPERVIPSSIRDIVEMVQHESNYHEIRQPKQEVTLFEFNISKVPLHIKKKYDLIFRKTRK